MKAFRIQHAATLIAAALLATPVSAEETGLPLHGFADVIMGGSSPTTPSEQRINGFGTGTLDLYLVPQFGDNVKSILELAFETDAGEGAVVVDVERLQIGYTYADFLTIWAGRFHTPYGHWNTAYHHGAQFQTSINRPRFLDFEDKGGILPAHSVGLWATGRVKIGENRVNYDLYMSNGARLVPGGGGAGPEHLDPNIAKADKSRFTFGGNLSYGFGHALEGLSVGAYGYLGEVSAYDATPAQVSSTRVRVAGASVLYDAHEIELISEYFRFSNSDLAVEDAAGISSSAFYAQVGYALGASWKPYYRYEETSLDQTDNYFAGQVNANSYTRHVVGLRHEVNPMSAIKFEIVTTGMGDRINARYNIAQGQYSIRF